MLEQRTPVEIDGIGAGDFHAVGGKPAAQPFGEPRIFLDEEQAVAALEKRCGEGAQTRADFHGERRAVRGDSRGDGPGQILVVEKILAEAFGRAHLQLVERGADVGQAQDEKGFRCSVGSAQPKTSLRRQPFTAGAGDQASRSSG